LSGQIRVSRLVPERLRKSCYPPEHPRQLLAQELPDAPLGPASLQQPPARLLARRNSGVRNEAGQVVEITDTPVTDAPDLGAQSHAVLAPPTGSPAPIRSARPSAWTTSTTCPAAKPATCGCSGRFEGEVGYVSQLVLRAPAERLQTFASAPARGLYSSLPSGILTSGGEAKRDTSRALTEDQARRSEAVLVLEPGTGLAGKLKTARKGAGDFIVRS